MGGTLQRLLMELSQHTTVLSQHATVLNRHAASEAGVDRRFDELLDADAKPLVDYYGLPEPARAGVSYPMGMVLGLLDLASGLFVRGGVFDVFAHDLHGAVAVHDSLLSGDVLVGGSGALLSLSHRAAQPQAGCFAVFGCIRTTGQETRESCIGSGLNEIRGREIRGLVLWCARP